MTQPSVESIFSEAVKRTSPEERAAYLDAACGGNVPLRAEVERLLDAHAKTGPFLELPDADRTLDCDAPTAPVQGPGTVVGRYKLLQRLGEGGFGTVYMAEQEHPVRRRVALKLIKLGMDTRQVIARFEAERQALALMDHPHIAKVFDAGATATGRPYFVMELVRGVPITDYCDANHLTVPERLELFVQACQAVQHAHQKGIIHRDIKPSNVMVCMADGKPAVKVIDFGIAKATQARLTEKTLFTEFRQMVGTPQYMSPEQAEMAGIDIDTRSDVYSLGVLLYELLVGTTPFDPRELRSKAYAEMQRMIREVEPPRPSTRLSTMTDALPSIAAQRRVEPARLGKLIKGDLDWIVMRAMEKDRTRRYETANGLARDVRRCLDDEPVEASPPSAAYRLRKLARRYRAPLQVAVCFAVLLVVATAVSVWQAVRASRAMDAARAAEQIAVHERADAELKQAALLALQGERLAASASAWAQAPALFDEATRLLAKNLAQPDDKFLAARGKAYARAGRFVEAAADFSRLIDLKPDDYWNWHQGMPLLLQVNDIDGYRRRRVQALKQFAATTEPITLQTIPKDCCMLPLDGAEQLRQTVALADRAPPGRTPAWFYQMKGMVEYRAGHLPQAITWFQESTDGTFPPRTAASEFFLAMVYHKAGDAARARAEFDRGASLLDHAIVLTDSSFPDWILCHIAHREAAALFAAAPTPAAPLTRTTTAPAGDQPDLRAAEVVCRQVLAGWEQQVSQSPGDPENRLGLAHSLWRLAEIQFAAGHATDAEADLRRAIDLLAAVAAENPKNTGYRQELARGNHRLADLLLATQRPRPAADAYRRAHDLYAAIAADAPHRTFYYEEFCATCAQLGQTLVAVGDLDEAERVYREVIPVCQRMAIKSPAVVGTPWGLADTSRQLARLLRGHGQAAQSDDVCRAQLELLVRRAAQVAKDDKLAEADRNAQSRAYRDACRELLRDQVKDGLHTPETLDDFARFLTANPDAQGWNATWATEISASADALRRDRSAPESRGPATAPVTRPATATDTVNSR